MNFVIDNNDTDNNSYIIQAERAENDACSDAKIGNSCMCRYP